MGAPHGNRNAAGSRGGATNKLRAALHRGRRRNIMSKLTGKKYMPKMYSMKLHKWISAKKYYSM
jgi:hypothetical protein